jgi:hypothetical protein
MARKSRATMTFAQADHLEREYRKRQEAAKAAGNPAAALAWWNSAEAALMLKGYVNDAEALKQQALMLERKRTARLQDVEREQGLVEYESNRAAKLEGWTGGGKRRHSKPRASRVGALAAAVNRLTR